MGLDIRILNEQRTQIYHSSVHGASLFERESEAFAALLSFWHRKEEEMTVVEPAHYQPLIPLFAEEKGKLERAGAGQGNGTLTLYDCVAKCYEGLLEAYATGKNIRIS